MWFEMNFGSRRILVTRLRFQHQAEERGRTALQRTGPTAQEKSSPTR